VLRLPTSMERFFFLRDSAAVPLATASERWMAGISTAGATTDILNKERSTANEACRKVLIRELGPCGVVHEARNAPATNGTGGHSGDENITPAIPPCV